ncbi:hypothetical protein HRbin01_00529 [archaeon HR01]|nr:hypothetical protein HRbin01_00529 [archaeon HR01]
MSRVGKTLDWGILVETVKALPLYHAHKAFVRDRILPENPSISPEELSLKLSIPLGEAMVILSEVRMTGEEVLEELSKAEEPTKRFLLAAIGGTFEVIHVGHLMLMLTAFRNAENVVIGLAGDELVAKLGKSHRVRMYHEREESLKKILAQHGWLGRCRIVRLEDPYGPTVEDPSIELLVVSPTTQQRAFEINSRRVERMLKPLKVIVTPLVLAADGQPVSTSRILRGEIDAEGRILSRDH